LHSFHSCFPAHSAACPIPINRKTDTRVAHPIHEKCVSRSEDQLMNWHTHTRTNTKCARPSSGPRGRSIKIIEFTDASSDATRALQHQCRSQSRRRKKIEESNRSGRENHNGQWWWCRDFDRPCPKFIDF